MIFRLTKFSFLEGLIVNDFIFSLKVLRFPDERKN